MSAAIGPSVAESLRMLEEERLRANLETALGALRYYARPIVAGRAPHAVFLDVGSVARRALDEMGEPR